MRSVLDTNAAVRAVRASFRAIAHGSARDMPKQRVAAGGTTLHAIGAVFADGLDGAPWAGAKVYVSGPAHTHWVLVFDANGLQALVSASELGRLRTGAATAVSVDLLAVSDAASLGVLGAGRQAWSQVRSVAAVRPLQRVTVWSRTELRAETLAERIRTELGIDALATTVPSVAVRDHDVVVTISKASEPILSGRDVAGHAHVVLAGSSHAHRKEADAELFARASTVYVDDLAVAQQHSGDLRAAVAAGTLEWDEVQLIGRAADPSGITVFKSHGMGSWDLALAVTALERARHQCVGVDVSPGTS